MSFKSLLIVFAFCLLSAGSVFGQGTISGKLLDSVSNQPLSLATVTVFRAEDTTILTYRLSDASGAFKVPGLPLNVQARVLISFSGYRTYRHEFMLTPDKPALDLGSLKLVNDPASMNEVVVTAERPPVSFKKDTIEFNASAFKTLPTALVEDLLKKLPGVDVDRDGNITVNGRKANRILVDGKEFFGGDPKIATRNLPADVIDKVQVTDDKEQLNANPDMDPNDVGKVINLTFKKAIKQGLFGKVYAGGGTDKRYEAGGIVNMFRDTFQLSALAYTNNLNKPGFGFGDISSMGGFQRSGVNSISVFSDGGFSFNDVSFGGTGQGVQRSTGAGFNANHQIGKKLTLNLQYFYGHINSDIRQITNVEQFLGDTALTTRSVNRQVNDDFSHKVGGRIRWKIDSLSDFVYTPSLTFRKNLVDRNLETNAFNNFQPKLSQSINSQNNVSNGISYSHDIYYNKSFKKKGRTLNITSNLNTNSTDLDQYNEAENAFYNPAEYYTRLDQLRNRDQNTFRTNLNVTFSEPISKTVTMRLSNVADYFSDNDDISTFNSRQNDGKYDSLNNTLTNGFQRAGFRNNASAGIRWKLGKLTIGPSVNFQSLYIDNKFLKNDPIKQDFFYVLPSLNIQWNGFGFNYSARAQEPQVNDLQPVVDNTNPLYIQLGNPSLVPAIMQQLSLNFFKHDQKHSITYNAYMMGSISDNTVIRERTVDAQGVQTTRPVNVNGIWQFNGSGGVRKQIKLINSWNMALAANFFGNYSKSVILINRVRSEANNWTLNPSGTLSFNYKDLFEINETYRLTWTKSVYDNAEFPGLEFMRHNSNTDLVVRLPKHWVWETSVDYFYNPQVAPGIRKSNFRWNAGVNFLFLKNDQAQLKFHVFDLLNQNVQVQRTVRENYIQDFQTSVLQRYFMLTFTYNIRNLNAGKVGGRQSMFMF